MDGSQVHNQTRSREMGRVAAELLDASGAAKGKGTPIPGFSLADCVPAAADSHRAVLSWAGGAAAPAGHESIKVRFVLLRARLYSYSWE